MNKLEHKGKKQQTKNVDEVGNKKRKFQKYPQTETRKKISRKNTADATGYMTGAGARQKDKLVKNATSPITSLDVLDANK